MSIIDVNPVINFDCDKSNRSPRLIIIDQIGIILQDLLTHLKKYANIASNMDNFKQQLRLRRALTTNRIRGMVGLFCMISGA